MRCWRDCATVFPMNKARLLRETDARFPVGPFVPMDAVTQEMRERAVEEIAGLPGALRRAVDEWDEGQLGTPYRPDGWSVRQLIHHVADSHMNSFVRMRLALTEDWPTIKPYQQDRWAELVDSAEPVASSLGIFEGLHERWVAMLRGLTEAEWSRGFVHPEAGRMTVEEAALLYGWHSRHHLAQIVRLKETRGW